MGKHVSKSLTSILDSKISKAVMDRNADIVSSVKEVDNFWGFDLFSRKPGPAYNNNDIFVGTDLDLACFLYELSERGAVINIPKYESLGQTVLKEGVRFLNKGNRHGQIINLVSNQNFFSFSLRMKDMNIITQDENGKETIGDYRNFALTDYYGDWYKGWERIEFSPSAKENKFLSEAGIWSNNKIIFKYFIHPNRWISFFGKYYFLTKLMIQRLEDETSVLSKKIKEIEQEKGVVKVPYKSSVISEGKKKSVKFNAFVVEVDTPEFSGEYSHPTDLEEAYQLRNFYKKHLQRLRFMTRTVEYSHFKNQDRLPAWLKEVKWEKDFVQPGKRTKWKRLVLFQPKVGEYGVSLRKRTFQKSQIVNENFVEKNK